MVRERSRLIPRPRIRYCHAKVKHKSNGMADFYILGNECDQSMEARIDITFFVQRKQILAPIYILGLSRSGDVVKAPRIISYDASSRRKTIFLPNNVINVSMFDHIPENSFLDI